MRFIKKYQRGIFLLFLLLIIISGVSLFNNTSKDNLIDEKALPITAMDDGWEDNDDFWNASWVSPSYYSSLIIEGYDEDWFQTYLNPGDVINVNIYFSHVDGDLNLELYDPTNSLRDGAYSSTDDEYISYTADMSGDWRIRVYRLTGSIDEYYDLEIWLTSADDWMEDNDDYDNAWYVDPNYYSSLKIVGSDEDWFRTYLNPDDVIDISIYFNHFDGDLELELYDPSYVYRVGSYSSDNDEYISYTADMSGDWRIRVYRVSGTVDQSYDLDIFLSGGDDWLEDNDDFYNPAWIDPNYISGLKMVSYDEDWYGIHLVNGDILNVFIYFDNTQGDLQLELYDPSYSLQSYSYSTNDEESFIFTIDTTGNWRIRVYRVSGSGDVYYDLNIWLEEAVPKDDNFEENDGFYDSAYIMPDWYGDLRIIDDDNDWFHSYFNSGELIDVSIHFEHEEGDLELELYDPLYKKRASSSSSTETWFQEKEKIKFKTDMSGDWRIRVYHKTGDSSVHYDMELWILDDWYEKNDYFNDAYYLTDDERKWLSNIGGTAVQNDEDWYQIEVTPGFQHLLVNLKFNKSLGDIDVEIYERWDEWSINWIGANYSMTGDDIIDIDYYGINPGVYLILVMGDFSGLEYDMWYDDNRTDFRSDDYYEENDDPTTAYDLSDYPHIELWDINGLALQYDNDWYRITIQEPLTYLEVYLMYDYQEGALGIEIYNWDYSKITSNFSMDDNEVIKYDLPSNGTYYIRIYGDLSGNVYNMLWQPGRLETEAMIASYDALIILIGIFGVTTIITVKIKRSKKYHL